MDQFIFVDIETTGLDERHDCILEVALVVADYDLQIKNETSYVLALPRHYPASEWGPGVETMHGTSGLLDLCAHSDHDPYTVESKLLDWLKKAGFKENLHPMCGNSVHFDRRFLRAYMPMLEEFFHYRNIDVSTIKGLAKAWYVGEAPKPAIKPHRALLDCRDSISELKWYRENIFSGQPSPPAGGTTGTAPIPVHRANPFLANPFKGKAA